MDATGPRTIRPTENAPPEQAGTPLSHPESEQRTGPPENDVQQDRPARFSHTPSPIVRVPGQDGDHAQRFPEDTSGGVATAGQASSGGQANGSTFKGDKLEEFKKITGKGGYENLNHKIRRAHQLHTYQYWFVATSSNALLFLQVLIAASLTVLGAFNDRKARTATIFLGGANTVIAALLTYFKTRNQPNRARQFRNDLGKVVDQLDDAEANFRAASAPPDVVSSIQDIRNAYKQARADAETNYPDLWVKAGDVRNPFSPDRKDKPSAPAPAPGQTPAPGQAPPQAQHHSGSDFLASGALNDPPSPNNIRTGQQGTG